MAGMLPGVECARRRRSGGWSESPAGSEAQGWTRRPAFCLYTTKLKTHLRATPPSLEGSRVQQTRQDEKLGGMAREAKDRLDERLRTQKKTEPTRQNRGERFCGSGGTGEAQGGGSKKEKKGFKWGKLGMMAAAGKAASPEDCAVCLEGYEAGEEGVVRLPCAHRFHSRCLEPWLQTHAQCPCCRFHISP